MGGRLQDMVSFIDTNTKIFKGSTSLNLELIEDDKFIVKIPFKRDSAPDQTDGKLVRGDITLRDCQRFRDAAGKVYNSDEWKSHTTSRALNVKDQFLVSDQQYHALRSLFLDLANRQGCCNSAVARPKQHLIPPLNSLKDYRSLLDSKAKLDLCLQPIMAAPSIISLGVECDDCSATATCYCTHKNCEKSKIMCSVHFAFHKDRKTTKDHVVYSIALPPHYIRPSNMIGAAFDIKRIVHSGLTLFWDKLVTRVEKGLAIFLRFTIDGAMLTLSKNFCSASLRWLVDGLAPELAEWLLATVHCAETAENVDLYFRPLLNDVADLNATGLSFTPTGSKSAVTVKLRILICPDGKMLNCNPTFLYSNPLSHQYSNPPFRSLWRPIPYVWYSDCDTSILLVLFYICYV